MATHPFFPPPSAPPPPPLEHSAGSITLGIIMAIAAAAGIGISMVTQRYALASLKPRVYLWPCGMMTKFRVWFCGLVMYGAANGMQAFSLTGRRAACLSIGQFRPEKDHQLQLRAFKVLPYG